MRDIELNSSVLALEGFPAATRRVMFMYDSRGWAMRCYDKDGNKLTTLVFTEKIGDEGTIGTLIAEAEPEANDKHCSPNCRCIKINQ